MAQTPDITIIGGGLVGLSTAVGLLQAGHRVQVLDGADSDLRASQGNFGLVWLQGKGANYAPYAELTRDAVELWPDYAATLQDLTGVDIGLDQSGGFEFFTDVAEFSAFAQDLQKQQATLGNRFHHEVISGDDLRRTHPEIGPGVVGATFTTLDGHVNPLRLLRALRMAVTRLGGQVRTDAFVDDIIPGAGGFDLHLRGGERLGAERIVLCAGLGAAHLAARLGFSTKVRPQRGELLITEKLGIQLPFISSTIRQVDEGGLQIGGTKADVGLDDRETTDVMAQLANHAVTVLPALHDVRVIRAWGALRVLSPDGYPVYARSATHPGAALVTCHSGVTLASFHGTQLASWLDGAAQAPDLEAFDEHRFAVSDPS